MSVEEVKNIMRKMTIEELEKVVDFGNDLIERDEQLTDDIALVPDLDENDELAF